MVDYFPWKVSSCYSMKKCNISNDVSAYNESKGLPIYTLQQYFTLGSIVTTWTIKFNTGPFYQVPIPSWQSFMLIWYHSFSICDRLIRTSFITHIFLDSRPHVEVGRCKIHRLHHVFTCKMISDYTISKFIF